jgi:hypothetical protein
MKYFKGKSWPFLARSACVLAKYIGAYVSMDLKGNSTPLLFFLPDIDTKFSLDRIYS